MLKIGITLNKISKTYGSNEILKDFTYEFADNSKTVILGKSGCGKTTLLSIILGAVKPDSGNISGTDNKVFSVLFQEDRLLEQCDAMTNIKFVLKKSTYTESDIAHTLESLGINEPIGKPVSEFSGGMKRRVAICRSLLYSSDILLMDEPFRSLDYETSLKIIPIINSFCEDRIVISVLHQPEFAEMLNSEIIFL